MLCTETFFFFLWKYVNYRVRTGPGNPEKNLNFSQAFSRSGKSLKKVRGPVKSWKSVSSSTKVFMKDMEEQPDGKIQQP